MRSSIASLLALCLVGFVSAISSTGTRLLVILDDASDKDKYTKFWGDLNGMLITRHSFCFLS
jgi:oligosaccharyltransferase complex subunit beta